MPKLDVIYTFDNNGPLNLTAPECQRKGVIGPTQKVCVDYVSSMRSDGDLYLHLLFDDDLRFSISFSCELRQRHANDAQRLRAARACSASRSASGSCVLMCDAGCRQRGRIPARARRSGEELCLRSIRRALCGLVSCPSGEQRSGLHPICRGNKVAAGWRRPRRALFWMMAKACSGRPASKCASAAAMSVIHYFLGFS